MLGDRRGQNRGPHCVLQSVLGTNMWEAMEQSPAGSKQDEEIGNVSRHRTVVAARFISV